MTSNLEDALLDVSNCRVKLAVTPSGEQTVTFTEPCKKYGCLDCHANNLVACMCPCCMNTCDCEKKVDVHDDYCWTCGYHDPHANGYNCYREIVDH